MATVCLQNSAARPLAGKKIDLLRYYSMLPSRNKPDDGFLPGLPSLLRDLLTDLRDEGADCSLPGRLAQSNVRGSDVLVILEPAQKFELLPYYTSTAGKRLAGLVSGEISGRLKEAAPVNGTGDYLLSNSIPVALIVRVPERVLFDERLLAAFNDSLAAALRKFFAR